MYEWLVAPPGSLPPRWDPGWARAAIAETIEGPDSALFVAERRGELLGFASAYLDLNSVRFGRRCWVEDLAVSPEHRSEGIGKALLDAAKRWARGRGAGLDGQAVQLAALSAQLRSEADGPHLSFPSAPDAGERCAPHPDFRQR